MNVGLAAEIEAEITNLVVRLCPGAKGRSMYGGTIFEKQPGVFKSSFCGVFCYKNHISLEFSHGAKLADPSGYLEGNGKMRRHLKLRVMADLAAKDAERFVSAAFFRQP